MEVLFLLGHRHRVRQGLVAVPQVGGQPPGGPGDPVVWPFPLG